MMQLLDRLDRVTREATLHRRLGHVRQVVGLTIESDGPAVQLGEVCRIQSGASEDTVAAEAVGLRNGRVILMPFGSTHGLAAGAEVEALGEFGAVPTGHALLGRVIDAFGQPLDGGKPITAAVRRPVNASPINPMLRPRITQVLETGVRCIDTLISLGHGQRVGIFAGSGVGKSTLLGMVARHVQADVNVIALIGERGREVREFIDKHLGVEGLRRSVVVVATADQPALVRLRAARAALTIAEAFRDDGQQVLLTMDSITRFAMARREVGLSSGEPPTARGYPPSVFAEIPELCERCGTADSGGAITALFTVLVEGDDLNEPISDLLRATLDGHVVLSRRLAQRGMYPAIDVLASASRVMGDIVAPEAIRLSRAAGRMLALLNDSRSLVDIGAYVAGTNLELDRALHHEQALEAFLTQAVGGVPRQQALDALARALNGASMEATT
jgi:flagellum-specific ATP synthase